MIAEEIIKQAEKEYKEEVFRHEVEKYKQKLREKRSWIDVIFPFKIIIIKKEKRYVRCK